MLINTQSLPGVDTSSQQVTLPPHSDKAGAIRPNTRRLFALNNNVFKLRPLINFSPAFSGENHFIHVVNNISHEIHNQIIDLDDYRIYYG